MPAGDRGRLPYPALMLISDSARIRARQPTDDDGDRMAAIVREAVLGGVNIVQLREKQLSHARLIEVGRDVRDAIAGRGLFFVNGDIAAAIALGADGIHLPEVGATVAEARARAGGRMLISRAVHGIEAARMAERDGADFVQLGAVFATASKPGVEPLGIDGLRAVCEAVHVPVIAVGGVTVSNAASVLSAGAAGVAVIGAIFDAGSPRAAAEELGGDRKRYGAIGPAHRGTLMRITVNGKPREVEASDDAQAIALPEFLRRHEINPRLVAIAINGDVIPKEQYEAARIHHGDAVEVVRMVGGGAR